MVRLFPNYRAVERELYQTARIFPIMADDVGPEAFVRQQTAMIGRPDSRPALAWIRCPTLVLSGDEDHTIPNSLSKEMADGIHGAKLVILPDCGHLPQPEQPEATGAALLAWLRG